LPEGFAALIHCKFPQKILWKHNSKFLIRSNNNYIIAQDYLVVREVDVRTVGVYCCYTKNSELIGISKLSMKKLRKLLKLLYTFYIIAFIASLL